RIEADILSVRSQLGDIETCINRTAQPEYVIVPGTGIDPPMNIRLGPNFENVAISAENNGSGESVPAFYGAVVNHGDGARARMADNGRASLRGRAVAFGPRGVSFAHAALSAKQID